MMLFANTVQKLYLNYCHFWRFFGQRNFDFESSHKNHFWYTLEDTFEIILGSFKPNAMTKFDVICQKASKTWIIGQDGHFWHFWPKSLWFWIFPQIPLLIHARQYLWDHFRKISVIKSSQSRQKILKLWFCVKMTIFWHF